ncbi:MAG: ribonuclease HII [bacterium]|nr:ribonuclease HII [bacterium]
MENYLFAETEKADTRSAFSIKPTFDIEKELINQGYHTIAGVDEAGRGCLAGPLSVGLVIYSSSFISNPHDEILRNINDSKKIPHKRRAPLVDTINKHSQLSTYTMVSHKIIDRLNINGATEYAIKKLLSIIPVKPDILIMDGRFKFNLGIPYRSIIKGDSLSLSIASASIQAKVQRDRIIEKIDTIYPGYDLKTNKGYGTKKHREAIQEIGFSAIHRKSYEPVKSMISGQKGIFD